MKALYGIAKYRNNGSSFPVFVDYDVCPKNLTFFYENLAKRSYEKVDYIMLALSFAKYHLDRHPDDPFTQKYIEDLILELMESVPNFENMEPDSSDEYAKYYPGIEKMMEDTLFREPYFRAKETTKRRAEFIAFRETPKGAKKIEKIEKQRRKFGYQLGLDSIVVFSPFHYHLDARKESPISFLKTEKEQDMLPDYIEDAAEKLDLSVVLLDSKTLDSRAKGERFNDMMIANEWYADFVQHGDIKIVPMIYDEMQGLSEKYGTPYFVNMGSIAVRYNQSYITVKGTLIFAYTLSLALPWAIYEGFRVNTEGICFSIVMDVSDNDVVAYQHQELRDMNKGARLNAYMYYYLWQIKQGKK